MQRNHTHQAPYVLNGPDAQGNWIVTRSSITFGYFKTAAEANRLIDRLERLNSLTPAARLKMALDNLERLRRLKYVVAEVLPHRGEEYREKSLRRLAEAAGWKPLRTKDRHNLIAAADRDLPYPLHWRPKSSFSRLVFPVIQNAALIAAGLTCDEYHEFLLGVLREAR